MTVECKKKQCWTAVKEKLSNLGELEPIEEELCGESDRGVAIIAVCHLDNLLETLLKSYFYRKRGTDKLFSSDHILQTYSAKVNICYFLGLIPNYIYHDLKVLGQIRNKFGHGVISNLHFDTEYMAKRLDACELRSRTMDKMITNSAYRTKMVIVVTQVTVILRVITVLLTELKLKSFLDFFDFDNAPYEKWALTKGQISKIIKGKSK